MHYMNQIDTIKAVITYVTAAVLVIGGGASIIFVPMQADKLAIVSGIVGAGSAFLWGQETATRTARQIIAGQQTNGKQQETLSRA